MYFSITNHRVQMISRIQILILTLKKKGVVQIYFCHDKLAVCLQHERMAQNFLNGDAAFRHGVQNQFD